MKQEILVLGEKTYTITELKYKDVAAVADLDKGAVAKTLLMSSVGLSQEDYDELSMSDGVKIMNVVNEINGLVEQDFQTATQTTD